MTEHGGVLVIGAGPAGTTAALCLAEQGVTVVLVDPLDSVDTAGVLVSGPARQGLADLGLGLTEVLEPVDTAEIRFGPAASHTVTDYGAAICPRDRLYQALHQAATDAGIPILRGTVTSLTRTPEAHIAEIHTDTGTTTRLARHVVLATGAHPPDSPIMAADGDGMAVVRRFSGAPRPERRVLLVLPPPDSSRDDRNPLCAWMLPGPGDGVTVGAARLGSAVEPDSLLQGALRALRDTDPGFGGLEPAGPAVSGPLRTGFTPKRIRDAGLLLVGDAAGLVNPFTGEGLSYAVQSGLLAARAIAAHPDDPPAAVRRYARRLATTFVGYFETARHAARRYRLAWRILAAGAGSEHPFFAKGRRAILLPEGFSGLTAPERMDLATPAAVTLRPFLAACDEVAIATVRTEWPFLARLAMTGEPLGGQRLRPAVPFYAALLSGGARPAIGRATLGAAIELALLGTLAIMGPAPESAPDRGVDWALTSAILAGDFLLAQASRLVAESAPEVSWSFADWLAELTAVRAARLDPESGVPASAVFAALLEFPARIGAELGGGDPEIVAALRAYGAAAGEAFGHTEDALALRGERTRLDTTLAVMLDGRFSGVPDALGGPAAGAAVLADPGLRARALTAVTDAATAAYDHGRAAAEAVPDPAARHMLLEFIATITAPFPAEVGR